MMIPTLTVSDFVAITNQSLEVIYPSVIICGEVESFSVNQGKYVFFNLKDEQSSVGCFMMKFALHVTIEDGMLVQLRARPRLTQKGKFSLTVDSIQPVGEGSVKRGFELLRAKLEKEGLFDEAKKRPLPWWPKRVAVISSNQAAGYIDFMKIADSRVKGVDFLVYNTQVQGIDAPKSIATAIQNCNNLPDLPEVIVIVRGGGSADDLAAFNDEQVVRAIVASRVPVLVGVGHEVDTTLADLVADKRAATPTHAATILLPSQDDILAQIEAMKIRVLPRLHQYITEQKLHARSLKKLAYSQLEAHFANLRARFDSSSRLVRSLDPAHILKRGYAIVRGDVDILGSDIEIETSKYYIKAKVFNYESKQR